MVIGESLANGLAARLLDELERNTQSVPRCPDTLRTHQDKPIQAWKLLFARRAGSSYLGCIDVPYGGNKRVVWPVRLVPGKQVSSEGWTERALYPMTSLTFIWRRRAPLNLFCPMAFEISKHALARVFQRISISDVTHVDYCALVTRFHSMLFSSIALSYAVLDTSLNCSFQRFLLPFDGGAFLGVVRDMRLHVRTTISNKLMTSSQRDFAEGLRRLYSADVGRWTAWSMGCHDHPDLDESMQALFAQHRSMLAEVVDPDTAMGLDRVSQKDRAEAIS